MTVLLAVSKFKHIRSDEIHLHGISLCGVYNLTANRFLLAVSTRHSIVYCTYGHSCHLSPWSKTHKVYPLTTAYITKPSKYCRIHTEFICLRLVMEGGNRNRDYIYIQTLNWYENESNQ